ncbi:MAG: TIGR03545 family protein [Gammaproteobacteria bacterium]|nr:TIGR03545 family protein [Gammaproteobacteria bacterium]
MNRWFRWQGALGFIAVVGVVLSTAWFFLDNWIHYAIERSGEDLVGAKVELDQVNTTLFPLGLELINLQVADSDEPFKNLIQIETIRTHIDPLYLLMGQAIFDEAEILVVQFETERQTSGALRDSQSRSASKETSSVVEGVLEDVGVTPPSVDSILEKETLVTQTNAEALDELYQQCERAGNEAKRRIPDKKRLKQYENRLQLIIKGKMESVADFKKRKRDLKQLKTEIRATKKQIDTSKAKLLSCRSDFNKALKELRKSPKEDLKRLKNKYQFSENGASNFSRLLFGDEAEKKLNEAMTWYKRLAPILLESDPKEDESARYLGRNIHYGGVNPLPDFLIRSAKISVHLANGVYVGELRDITHQQNILGRPLLLNLTGRDLKELEAFSLEGTFDRRVKNKGKDTLSLMVDGVQVSDLKLMSLKGKAFHLAAAKAHLKAQATYYQQNLDLTSNMEFVNARFTGGGKKGIEKQLGLALASIDQFNLDAKASGPLDDLDVNLKSNLDKKVGKAISMRMKQKQKEMEKKLEKKINAQLVAYLTEHKIDSGRFNIDVDNLSASMNKNKAQLEGMLKSEVADYEAQKKKELKQKQAAEKQRLKNKADRELKDKLKTLKLKF